MTLVEAIIAMARSPDLPTLYERRAEAEMIAESIDAARAAMEERMTPEKIYAHVEAAVESIETLEAGDCDLVESRALDKRIAEHLVRAEAAANAGRIKTSDKPRLYFRRLVVEDIERLWRRARSAIGVEVES